MRMERGRPPRPAVAAESRRRNAAELWQAARAGRAADGSETEIVARPIAGNVQLSRNFWQIPAEFVNRSGAIEDGRRD
ncbi:MAG: hypothetical protein Kow0045_05430 [Albidovulum sp.]